MSARKSYIDKNDDAKELDAQFFAEAKRGRPTLPQEERKQQVTMLLDPDVIAFFKKDGRGWQTRVNAALREFTGLK
jgi:uncharacterized protein (DUF4415 family)